MRYNWQQADWSDFRYEVKPLEATLWQISDLMGRMGGLWEGLAPDAQTDTVIELMLVEAMQTSAIEGEYLSREDVMSSLQNQLSLNVPMAAVGDRRAQGAAELMLEVRRSFAEPLTEAQLLSWHRLLMQGQTHARVGVWRSKADPMRVVSGAIGREIVHFETPPATAVSQEMQRFFDWFVQTSPVGAAALPQPVIRAGLAHVYFLTIHPFEDGNGRIGRALAEKALSQTLGRPVLLSLSQSIEADRPAYYQALKQAQRSNELTPWLRYFADLILQAQQRAEALLTFTVQKARFFDCCEAQCNARQLKALRRMFAAGPEGFVGGMNARMYASITRVSKATATRDLQQLVSIGALRTEGAGRGVRYEVRIGEER